MGVGSDQMVADELADLPAGGRGHHSTLHVERDDRDVVAGEDIKPPQREQRPPAQITPE